LDSRGTLFLLLAASGQCYAGLIALPIKLGKLICPGLIILLKNRWNLNKAGEIFDENLGKF
jgi:hypothetical protein